MTETAREFGDRFTIIPDSGIVELKCFRCPGLPIGNDTWRVGYHPSLDVLIEQARAHNLAEHNGTVGAREPEPPGFMKDVEIQGVYVFGTSEPVSWRLQHKPTGIIVEYPTREEAVWRLGFELVKRGDITVNDARAASGLPPIPAPADPFADKAAQRGG